MTAKPLLDTLRRYLLSRKDEITRTWFGRFDWNLPQRALEPQTVPAVAELPELMNYCGPDETELTKTFIGASNRLHWIRSYTADDFGQYMVDHYGFVELIGTRGHFVSDEIAAGLVFFGRGIDYPNHWHGSHALYYPMTGTGFWSQNNGAYELKKAGEIVVHEPNEHHALRVPDDPLLAVWAWRGGDLAQKGNY